jgi:predicted amidohydrolase
MECDDLMGADNEKDEVEQGSCLAPGSPGGKQLFGVRTSVDLRDDTPVGVTICATLSQFPEFFRFLQ